MPETFIPPASVAKEAKKAILWKEKGLSQGAGTRIGWTRARQLADRKPVSLSTIKRIYSYLSRHSVDKKAEDFNSKLRPSKGKIMWCAWGGDPALSWVKSVLGKVDKKEEVAALQPKPWYGYRKVLNPLDIIKWAGSQGFTNVCHPDDLHVTFCYSKAPFNLPDRSLSKIRLSIHANDTKYDILGKEKDTHVITFSSNDLKKYHSDLISAGASYDFPEYKPHISFSREKTSFAVTPYSGKIILGKERFEEIDTNKVKPNKPSMNIEDAEVLANALSCRDTVKVVASDSAGKAIPLNQKLWNKCVKKAQDTFDVWPSRYASFYAVKLYKDKGGKWK